MALQSSKNNTNYYICPHCVNRFSYDNIWFRCAQPNLSSKAKHKKQVDFLSKIISDDNAKAKRRGETSQFYNKALRELAREMDIVINNDRQMPRAICIEKISDAIKEGCFRCTKTSPKDGSNIPTEDKCPCCKERTRMVVCPKCRKPVEIDVNDHQFIVALAGLRRCGKSVFLAALIKVVLEKLCDFTSNWTIDIEDPSGHIVNFESILQKDADPLYNPEKILGIQSTEIAQSSPLILRFKKMDDKGIEKTYSFIFYDVAGEIFHSVNPENFAENHENALQFSYPDFILMMVEPGRITELSNMMKKSPDVSEETKKYYLMTEGRIKEEKSQGMLNMRNENVVVKIRDLVADTIYQYVSEDDEQTIDATVREIPFAVCITMSDRIEISDVKYLERSTLLEDYDYNKYSAGRDERHEALKEALCAFKERTFVSTVTNNFPNNFFAAITARDENYKETNEFSPSNILDPFLWIIDQVCPEILTGTQIVSSGDARNQELSSDNFTFEQPTDSDDGFPD